MVLYTADYRQLDVSLKYSSCSGEVVQNRSAITSLNESLVSVFLDTKAVSMGTFKEKLPAPTHSLIT
jgi:hypothetical protein